MGRPEDPCAVNLLAAPALASHAAVVALDALVSLALLVIAVRAFPPPPIATMAVASACFGARLPPCPRRDVAQERLAIA